MFARSMFARSMVIVRPAHCQPQHGTVIDPGDCRVTYSKTVAHPVKGPRLPQGLGPMGLAGELLIDRGWLARDSKRGRRHGPIIQKDRWNWREPTDLSRLGSRLTCYEHRTTHGQESPVCREHQSC